MGIFRRRVSAQVTQAGVEPPSVIMGDDECSFTSSLESSESFDEEISECFDGCNNTNNKGLAAVDRLPHMLMMMLPSHKLQRLMVKQLEQFWQDVPFNCIIFESPREGFVGFIGGQMTFILDHDWALLPDGRQEKEDDATSDDDQHSSNTFQVRVAVCSVPANEEERNELQSKVEDMRKSLNGNTHLYECGTGELVLVKRKLDMSLLGETQFSTFEKMLDEFMGHAGCCRKMLKDASKRARRNSRRRISSSRDSLIRRLVATKAA